METTPGSEEPAEEVDYKAKYEAMKTHSREWETKAKANLAAAKKLKELEDTEKTVVDKLAEQLAEVEKAKAALQIELDRMTIATLFVVAVPSLCRDVTVERVCHLCR